MTTAAQRQGTFTIGEVAELTGLSVHALRYYERQDLLIDPVQRTSGGRRRYTDVDVDWIRICVRLRESGMPLAELTKFAALIRQGPGNENDRLMLLEEHRQRVEAQIWALEECRLLIQWKVGVYSEHLQAGSAAGLWDPTQ